MIKLILLGPDSELVLQQWIFNDLSKVYIGRSVSNEVVLYSAIVSRRHLIILRAEDGNWVIKNLGANGTFLEGKPIDEVLARDGMTIRIAGLGPQLRINLEQQKIDSSQIELNTDFPESLANEISKEEDLTNYLFKR